MSSASTNSQNIYLAYTPEVEADTAAIYEKVKDVIPAIEWPVYAPLIDAINKLKKEKNAVILAHNYQTPEIFHGVADLSGDSLALAKMAAETDAEVIVQCGVHFMAETAKLLNPDKTVLLPDMRAGCSLAESITGRDVRLLKEKYPGAPVVTYVNTSADVKSETDICCTSSNAVEIVESLDSDRIIFIPDEYLGKWVASQTDKELILWKGHCEVHERFTADELRGAREQYGEDLVILAHPECPPDVLAEADFVGSTSAMANHVSDSGAERVLMVTECSMSDNVAVANPNTEFIRPCNLCPHMKRITLQGVLKSLQTMTHEIIIDPETLKKARGAVERMIQFNDEKAIRRPKKAN